MRALFITLVAFAAAACGGGPGKPDGGSDAGDRPPCVQGVATTHLELINACTDALKIEKNPTLPLRLPDGGLPPLP
ncbi:MAG TPA: hypothetical protein VIG99_13205 [Myxococcaceae bacterium]|jgi:hypothetical protein